MAPPPSRRTCVPDYEGVMETSTENLLMISRTASVKAAYALDSHGIAAAVSKMAFGNALGVTIEHNVDARDFFAPYLEI